MIVSRVTVLAAILCAPAAFANAQEALVDFMLPITVTDGVSSTTLTIGMKEGANVGRDAYDKVAPPPPPSGAFDARLIGPDTDYFTDVRPLDGDPIEFELAYQVGTGGAAIELTWDPDQFAQYGAFVIIDKFDTGLVEVDMTEEESLDTSTESVLENGLLIRATAASDTPIPVELSSFGARLEGQSVRLHWQTQSETNNAGFFVESRRVGETYHRQGFVSGAGTTSRPQNYRYRIDDVDPGRYDFRLRQLDQDGSFSYSRSVTVEVTVDGAYRMSRPTPHPVQTHTRFELSVDRPQRVVFEVVNLLGHRMYTAEVHLEAHRAHPFELAMDQLQWAGGTYFLRVRGETFTATERIAVVR